MIPSAQVLLARARVHHLVANAVYMDTFLCIAESTSNKGELGFALANFMAACEYVRSKDVARLCAEWETNGQYWEAQMDGDADAAACATPGGSAAPARMDPLGVLRPAGFKPGAPGAAAGRSGVQRGREASSEGGGDAGIGPAERTDIARTDSPGGSPPPTPQPEAGGAGLQPIRTRVASGGLGGQAAAMSVMSLPTPEPFSIAAAGKRGSDSSAGSSPGRHNPGSGQPAGLSCSTGVLTPRQPGSRAASPLQSGGGGRKGAAHSPRRSPLGGPQSAAPDPPPLELSHPPPPPGRSPLSHSTSMMDVPILLLEEMDVPLLRLEQPPRAA